MQSDSLARLGRIDYSSKTARLMDSQADLAWQGG